MKTGASLEVLFTPAEFNALGRRDLSETVCVVFDVLRATSSMVTALANGAEVVIPVAEISEALALKQSEPGLLLAGERHGRRIEANLTGGVDFDLGNSPREFTRERVAGRRLAMTTTNGTRALRACSKARQVLVGSFLNLEATARFVEKSAPGQLLVICSGTFEEASFEDALAAGALCDRLWPHYGGAIADSALMCRRLYLMARDNLLSTLSEAANGRRLLSLADLRDDVAFCAQRDIFPLIIELGHAGVVTARKQPPAER
jgi:2-phosphosulfolactate phosphatase